MNKSILLLAFLALPFGLSAQTKPAARKSTTSVKGASVNRPIARRPAATPVAVAPAKAAGVTPVAVAAPPQTASVAETTAAPSPAQKSSAVQKANPMTRGAANSTSTARATVALPADGESSVRVGVRAGAGASTATGINNSELEGAQLSPVLGFHGGIVLSIGRRAFTVQPEVLFSQYGVKAASGSAYVQVKSNTVEVPLLLKYTFGQANTRFFINAGPTVTYRLNTTLSARIGNESVELPVDGSAQDSRINYGGSAGMGVALNVGRGQLQLEARGTCLMPSSAEASGQLIAGNVSLGYLIPIGR